MYSFALQAINQQEVDPCMSPLRVTIVCTMSSRTDIIMYMCTFMYVCVSVVIQRTVSADSSGVELRKTSPRKKNQANTNSTYSDAVRLAGRLYMMDSYRKSEVAGKLADM